MNLQWHVNCPNSIKKEREMRIIFLIMLFIASSNLITLAQDSTVGKKQNRVKQKIKHSAGFVDKNNDGYNDNAPDYDGDGIPNGLDSDYLNARKNKRANKLQYIDRDGDGINDNFQFNRFRKRNMWFSNGAKKSPQSNQPAANNKQNERRRNSGKK